MKNIFTLILILIMGNISLAQTILFTEDFEGGSLSSWSVVSTATDGGWVIGDATTASSSYLNFPAHTNFVFTSSF